MFKYTNITPNSSKYDIQSFFIFCVLVAGKSANFSHDKTNRLLHTLEGELPFDGIATLIKSNKLESTLREIKTGKYSLLVPCFEQVVYLDLKKCSRSDLLNLKGVGPKTANFFLLWTRENQQHAVLDTHILKHLKANGVANVPKATPPDGSLYSRLETEFLKLVAKTDMTVKDYDYMVWESYQKK